MSEPGLIILLICSALSSILISTVKYYFGVKRIKRFKEQMDRSKLWPAIIQGSVLEIEHMKRYDERLSASSWIYSVKERQAFLDEEESLKEKIRTIEGKGLK